MTPTEPKRILFVFNWLVVGGEETEIRLLAKHLNPLCYRLEVVACFRKPNMPNQTYEQLTAIGVPVDCTPYTLSFEETVMYLAKKIPAYDLVVSCQAAPDVYPALRMIDTPPPLIEHGGLVSEALRGPKDLTTRYVGVCTSIRDAAAARMPDRPHHALMIPSLVDLGEFDPAQRGGVRQELGIPHHACVVGWVGRLDRKKRVEDFIRAAALVHSTSPSTRFLVIGGPDAFMPEYADELRSLAQELGLSGVLSFLGDRADVPRLMSALDIFVWLSRGEGMPHVISEAGAASLPVIATRDNGTEEQIVDGVSGLFVGHESPIEVAAAIERLILRPQLRRWLGHNLRCKVEREYSAHVVVRRWEALFDELLNSHSQPLAHAIFPTRYPNVITSVEEPSNSRARRFSSSASVVRDGNLSRY